MPFIIKLALALSAVFIGAFKIILHSGTASMVAIQMCSGRTTYLPLDTPLLERAHCWGCYVAAAGLAYLVFILVQRLRHPRNFFQTQLS